MHWIRFDSFDFDQLTSRARTQFRILCDAAYKRPECQYDRYKTMKIWMCSTPASCVRINWATSSTECVGINLMCRNHDFCRNQFRPRNRNLCPNRQSGGNPMENHHMNVSKSTQYGHFKKMCSFLENVLILTKMSLSITAAKSEVFFRFCINNNKTKAYSTTRLLE
jgi:hypothetical protein